MRKGALITYRIMHLGAKGCQISYIKATSSDHAKRAFKEECAEKVLQATKAEW